MNKITFNLMILGSMACLLTACLTPAQETSWTDPEFSGRPIGKTIVLGVAESSIKCHQYEELFVARLLELGVAASSLHANHEVTDKLDRDGLAALLKANDVDSIIVTRVLSETERNQVVTTGYGTTQYGNYWGYYDYGYTVTFNSADIVSFREFELETNLYDVDSEKLVWTGRKVVYDDRSDEKNMKGVIKSVVKDFSKEGFID